MNLTTIRGYNELTIDQRELFILTYSRHMRAMGKDMSFWYPLENVSHVEWDESNQTINVHFENGDWWHYNRNGTWFSGAH